MLDPPEQDVHSLRSTQRRIDLLHEVTSIHSGTTRTRSVYTQPPPPRKPFLQTLKNGIRIFIAWVFSNVGICVLVVGYLLFGAIMFQEIERRDGNPVFDSVNRSREAAVARLWAITERYNLLHPANWTREVEDIVVEYQLNIVAAEKEGYDGNDPAELWTFPGALLYSITVITTIGYGHLVPITPVGKIVSIFYAVFGVPLFLLYLSNIGNILATSFKWTYSRICKCQFNRRSNRYRVQTLTQQIHPPGMVDLPKDAKNQDSVSAAESFSVCSGLEEPECVQNYNDNYNDTSQVAVPITMSLTVMLGYICGGAILFGEWEGWSFLNGFYFCFITLSTIGFGDYLPGNTVTQDIGEAKIAGLVDLQFIFCSLYILLGMAVIAMCFNLMQEKVVRGVISLGRKLGIVKING